MTSRRTFMSVGLGVTAGVAAGILKPQAASAAMAELPKLPYAYDALEPYIDKMTMEIHHDKHHAGYVAKLNKALEEHPDLAKIPLEELLADHAAKVPEAAKSAIVNNGGGHINHSLFWATLAPNAGGEPKGKIGEAITGAFGSYENFKTKLSDAGGKRFGSGWAWLVKTPDGKLDIYSTANQDSPYMEGKTPLFGIDVWEHAYYLKYQNKRADYLAAVFNLINWPEVEKKL
jgi:superoxide dismutase, Fe-Mn family